MEPTISTLPLMQLASGDSLCLQIYEFRGAPGPAAYLQANLHGAELAGNAVIHRLITWLCTLEPAQLRGTLRLVPVCNPTGVNTRAHNFASGRFNPYDGRDYNRLFWDYEKVAEDIPGFAAAYRHSAAADIAKAYRAQIQSAFQREQQKLALAPHAPVHELYRTQLQGLAVDADYVIDLHSSSNRGLTYLYYLRGRAETASLFDLDFAILLDDYDGDAFDEAFLKPWLALEQAFEQLGRSLRFEVEAYTLELGSGMALEEAAVARGLRGVQRYLQAKGMVPGEPSPAQNAPMPLTRTSRVCKYYAPVGGMVQGRVEPGTWVQPGQTLYRLLSFNKAGQLPSLKAIQADRSGLVFDVSINHAVNQGEYVLALMQPD